MTVFMCQHPYCPHSAEAEIALSADRGLARYVCADPGCTEWAMGEFAADMPGARVTRTDLRDDFEPVPGFWGEEVTD